MGSTWFSKWNEPWSNEGVKLMFDPNTHTGSLLVVFKPILQDVCGGELLF